ncbi:MAG TPA: ABC transporter permease, partial [Symbiobacteriaceae bacterium]|nr:ABC transporter permease [Symbiobacteriaceae bacterium]
MARYILQRVLTMLVVAWVVVTLTFFMLKALPGGPFASERNIPEAILKSIQRRYNLDKPIGQQYVEYLKNVVVWDLGPSFKYQGLSVNQVINKGFPVSARLGGISILFSLLLGV